MAFSSDRGKAAALVALVFVLGIAFGVAGTLAGRRVFSAGAAAGGGRNNGQGQQISQLVRELKLTPDEERQVRQTLADTRERYDAIRREMEPQMEQIRERNRDRIRGILTAQQRTGFENLLAESRDRRGDQNRRNDQGNQGNRNASGNRNERVPQVARLTEQLHLTTEQQTQLSGILGDTKAGIDALRQQMNPLFEEARVQNRDRLSQIVTPEQRQGLEKFFERRGEERRRR